MPNILLGVTNPFFGKALKHWPHIVKLGDHNTLNGLLKSPSKSNNGVAEKQKGMSKFKLDSKPGLYSSSKTLLDKDKGRNKENRQIIFDRLFNFTKPQDFREFEIDITKKQINYFTFFPKAMVKRVQKGVQLKRPNAVQSALIRRHFLELTQTFMIPLGNIEICLKE